jgi:pimeloyl-ACP methyl ester carboxylesterase
MVNLRFRAIKESLPSLPKVNPNWRSSLNLSSISNNISEASTLKFPSFPFSDATARDSSSQAAVARQATASAISLSSPKDPLDSVLEDLTGDIVILGGYRGSILRSAEPPYQQLWAPVKVGLNMRKVNLEVGLTDEDEEDMPKTVRPSGMLKNMGPVDISRKFIRRLKACENARSGKLRVWDYGYDWRLSPHRLSVGLCEFLARLPSNQPGVAPDSRGALVVAHSLGGLITRHAVNQRPELFSGVLYAGVPQRTINILGPFRNGDAVLFNEKLLSAAVNFSIRTSFVFLPEDGFIFVDKVTGESYPVDFYDPEEWARWKLSPCVSTPVRPAAAKPQSSSFASLLPSSLRARGNSKSDKKGPEGIEAIDHTIAPQMSSTRRPNDESTAKESTTPGSEERKRYMEYLTRTLARTKQFRAELAHNSAHETQNVYPPMAVLYGKSVPTVYAAQVHGREAITQADAYGDLLFRAGDGVTLAKEAMLPEGYSVVKGGKVLTDRGHITMLGDLPAVGRALGALRRGRAKGIGLGEGRKRGGSDGKMNVK